MAQTNIKMIVNESFVLENRDFLICNGIGVEQTGNNYILYPPEGGFYVQNENDSAIIDKHYLSLVVNNCGELNVCNVYIKRYDPYLRSKYTILKRNRELWYVALDQNSRKPQESAKLRIQCLQGLADSSAKLTEFETENIELVD